MIESSLVLPYFLYKKVYYISYHQFLGSGIDQKKIDRWFLLDDDIVVAQDFETGRMVVSTRISNDLYWPSEDEIKTQSDAWVGMLLEEMKNSLEECTDLYDHWRYAKRRYGVKNNPLNRMAYIVGVDPDGRFRCNFEKLPSYIEKALSDADRKVGELVGVKDITEDDLYYSLG
jgi:hypothetical protein